MRCIDRLWLSVLPAVVLGAACAPDSGDSPGDVGRPDADGRDDGGVDGDASPDAPFACTPGEWACFGRTYYRCGPDGRSRTEETVCPSECDARLGCVLCRPGSRRCEGSVSLSCPADGDRWVRGRDCAEWGSVCGADGFCADPCGEAESTNSYVGCEYWPVALANTRELDPTAFDYRVVVANPNASAARVRVFRGDAEVRSVTVPPAGLSEIALPWIDGQSFAVALNDWRSLVVADGAYRLMSDLPVTVSQFNPFEYSSGGSFSYTNDASLLFPVHVLTGDYVGLSYMPLSNTRGTSGPFPDRTVLRFPGYVAVVGISADPTHVEILLAGNAEEAPGRFGATPGGGTISFTLARGEVAHVMAALPPDCVPGRPGFNRVEECTFGICDQFDTCAERDFDLTGSRIRADQPVAVFGGHTCAYVPTFAQACDHLEEQLAPIQSWGTAFAGAPMSDPARSDHNLVRVVAAFDDTEVIVDPPQAGVSGGTLAAGEWLQFIATEPFSVAGSRAIMVGQYILGQYYPNPVSERGDPAMTVLVPGEQYRPDYIFINPTSYNPGTNGQSYVLIVRPPGLPLTLDGAPVSAAWSPIAGREVGIVPVAGGTHAISAADRFGLVSFGLGSFTSYAAPAGLNLEQITVVVY